MLLKIGFFFWVLFEYEKRMKGVREDVKWRCVDGEKGFVAGGGDD